jgi:hypothetical protein
MLDTARRVRVAVLGFLLGCIPHVCDLNVEREGLPGHWVIRVYIDIEPPNLDHRHLHRPVFALQRHRLPRLQAACILEQLG